MLAAQQDQADSQVGVKAVPSDWPRTGNTMTRPAPISVWLQMRQELNVIG
jgi:hypothetical protein